MLCYNVVNVLTHVFTLYPFAFIIVLLCFVFFITKLFVILVINDLICFLILQGHFVYIMGF